MSESFLGNDPQSMRELATALDKARGDLEQALSGLEAKVQSVRWHGTDANKFKNDTWSGVKTKLNQVKTELESVRQNVDAQRQQQEQASAQ